MNKTVFFGIFLSLISIGSSSVFADSSSINYECRVDTSINESAIYTTIPFSGKMNSTKLKTGALGQLGYSIQVRNVLTESEIGQIEFEIKEPSGARTTLLTTTSSYFIYARAPLKVECSQVK